MIITLKSKFGPLPPGTYRLKSTGIEEDGLTQMVVTIGPHQGVTLFLPIPSCPYDEGNRDSSCFCRSGKEGLDKFGKCLTCHKTPFQIANGLMKRVNELEASLEDKKTQLFEETFREDMGK